MLPTTIMVKVTNVTLRTAGSALGVVSRCCPVIKMNHLIVSRGWGQRLPGPVCSRLGLRAPNATSCLVGISPVMSGR